MTATGSHSQPHLSPRSTLVWRVYFDQRVQQTAQRMGLTESKVNYYATHQALAKLGRIMRNGHAARGPRHRRMMDSPPNQSLLHQVGGSIDPTSSALVVMSKQLTSFETVGRTPWTDRSPRLTLWPEDAAASGSPTPVSYVSVC